MTPTQNRITKTFGPITLDLIKQSEYPNKAGNRPFQAQLRQEVITSYPGGSTGNSMTENLFAAEDFGFQGSTYTSQRVTWIPVPETATEEQVKALLAAKPNARIWNCLSNNVKDVMTDEQHYAVTSGQQTLDFFEDKLRIRDTNGNDLPGHDEEGKAQFRSSGFALEAKEDVDLRTYKGNNVNVEASVANVLATVGGEEDQDGLGG